MSNFENIYSKIKTENPFAIIFIGDFNAHSQLWCTKIEELFNKLVLFQLISEPTNFEPHKNPSCIDLIVTDEPNIILDSGTHQIVHCKVNFRIPPPLPFDRKIWHFNRANSAAIKRSMTSFPWRQHLNVNTDLSWQVRTFTDTFLNIMSNFIPNEPK